jgi:nicotinate-nucleotide adenylyltransferase
VSSLAGATGILGGTFDPVHLGHIAVAVQCLEQLELAEVRLIPAFQPPHRPPPSAPAADRLAMTRLAVTDHPGLIVDDLEVRRGGVSYTMPTLEELRASGLDRLVLLLGHDAAVEVSTWHRSGELGQVAETVVFTRNGAATPSTGGSLPPGARVIDVESPRVSATLVRRRLAAGLDVSTMLPASVLEYIRARGLYTAANGGSGERAVIIPAE